MKHVIKNGQFTIEDGAEAKKPSTEEAKPATKVEPNSDRKKSRNPDKNSDTGYSYSPKKDGKSEKFETGAKKKNTMTSQLYVEMFA